MSNLIDTGKLNSSGAAKLEAVHPVFRQIRDLVYKISGIFQIEGKLYLLSDGCARRMKEIGVSTPTEYFDRLTVHPNREAELRLLLNELTIGETCLFRSQPQIEALRKVILPELIKEKAKLTVKRLRLWSAGCSTGEEPHTLAITLLEESEGLLKGWQFEIVATDLNDRSVEAAKAGIYGDYALRFTTDYFKRKYFVPAQDNKLRIRDEVKKVISFSRLNLRDDSKILFMKGMDVIFCCNVMIYFDGAVRKRIVQHFYNDLLPNSYLFVGHAESLYGINNDFHLVHFPGATAYLKPEKRIGGGL